MNYLLLLGCACALALSACGGTAGDSSEPASSVAAEELKPDWGPLKKAASAPQRVLIPSDPSPKKVVVRDLKVGQGHTLRYGDSFVVKYVAFSLTGEELERQDLSWELGPGRVIKGWVIGLPGMRVGGRRELVIPSRLAYHDGDRIYVIELLKATT